MSDATQAIWKRALECSSIQQGPAERRLYAHHQGMLEQSRAALQQSTGSLTQRKDSFVQAQVHAGQSEVAAGLIEKMWRSKARKDALRDAEEQAEDVIAMAGATRAVQQYAMQDNALEPWASKPRVDYWGGVDAISLAATCRDPEGYDVARVQRGPVETAPSAAAFSEAYRADESDQVALRVEEALPSGDAVSVEVRQSDGEKLDATISVSEGILLSRVMREKKLLLARLDAAQLSIDRLEVVTHDSPGTGVRHRMRSRRRAATREGDNDEITLS